MYNLYCKELQFNY